MVMLWGDVNASLSCMSFQPVRWYTKRLPSWCLKKHLYTSFRDLIIYYILYTLRFLSISCPVSDSSLSITAKSHKFKVLGTRGYMFLLTVNE